MPDRRWGRRGEPQATSTEVITLLPPETAKKLMPAIVPPLVKPTEFSAVPSSSEYVERSLKPAPPVLLGPAVTSWAEATEAIPASAMMPKAIFISLSVVNRTTQPRTLTRVKGNVGLSPRNYRTRDAMPRVVVVQHASPRVADHL